MSKRAKSALFPLFRRHFSYAIFRLTHTYIGTYTHGVNVSQCVCFICISVFDFVAVGVYSIWRAARLLSSSRPMKSINLLHRLDPIYHFAAEKGFPSPVFSQHFPPFSTFACSATPTDMRLRGLSAKRCAYNFITRATRRMSDVVGASIMGWQFLMPTWTNGCETYASAALVNNEI